jgi:hypothetical protein
MNDICICKEVFISVLRHISQYGVAASYLTGLLSPPTWEIASVEKRFLAMTVGKRFVIRAAKACE